MTKFISGFGVLLSVQVEAVISSDEPGRGGKMGKKGNLSASFENWSLF